MARNGRTPTVPSPSPTSTLPHARSIPSIRIEKIEKVDEPLDLLAEPKPTPPPRDLTNTNSLGAPGRVKRQPRQTSIRPHANGNGVMKSGSPRETVVNFGFSEEPIPPSHWCCGKFKLEKVCRIVGIFSLIGFFINLVLYFMGISKLGLNGYLEAFLLIFDFIAVFTLMYGVSKKRSGMLKPYLFYNTVWSFGLILLFVVFLWHMFKGTHDISRNILDNLRTLRGNSIDYYQPQYSSTVAVLVTLGVMSAMLSVIIVDCMFLHIVYRTFQFFAYTEDKRREEMDKKERL